MAGIQQGGADAPAQGHLEGIGHAAADEDGVGLLQEVVDHPDLVRDLGPAQDGHQGALGLLQGFAHEVELFLHQEPCHRGQVVGYALGGGVGPVGSAEGVKDEDVRQGGQLSGEVRVVLLLLDAEPEILHQHGLAGLQGGALGFGVRAQDILGQGNGQAQQLFQVVPGGEEREFLLPLSVGTAHVGEEDDSGIVLQQIANGGQGGDNAGVVVDDPRGFVVGNVEVTAQENLFPGHVDVPDGLLIIVHQNKPLLFNFVRRRLQIPGESARAETAAPFSLPLRAAGESPAAGALHRSKWRQNWPG